MAKRVKAEIIHPEDEVKVNRVEIMKLNETELLPKTPEQFTMDLPPDRKECFQIMMADWVYAQKQTALRMWHIGKIIHTLHGRGEENVMEEAMALTQLKERALAYCVAVYKEFDDPQHIANLGKCLNWTSIRGLLKVHDKQNREALCDRVLKGELTDNNIDTAVKAVVAEERKEAKEDETTAPVGPPPKKLNHQAVMVKAENFIMETQKKMQQLEVEIVETLQNVWNRELVPEEEAFDNCINAFAKVEEAGKKLTECVSKFIKKTRAAADTDPLKT